MAPFVFFGKHSVPDRRKLTASKIFKILVPGFALSLVYQGEKRIIIVEPATQARRAPGSKPVSAQAARWNM
ncbi:MAG: hypothetical protein J0I91_05405 [Candidatus Accumulibacter sp.]|nr:hypothetical protein [Accumulibacter sp.]